MVHGARPRHLLCIRPYDHDAHVRVRPIWLPLDSSRGLQCFNIRLSELLAFPVIWMRLPFRRFVCLQVRLFPLDNLPCRSVITHAVFPGSRAERCWPPRVVRPAGCSLPASPGHELQVFPEPFAFLLVLHLPLALFAWGSDGVLRGFVRFAEDLQVVIREVPLGGGAAVPGWVDRGGCGDVVLQVAEHEQDEIDGSGVLGRSSAVGEFCLLPGG